MLWAVSLWYVYFSSFFQIFLKGERALEEACVPIRHGPGAISKTGTAVPFSVHPQQQYQEQKKAGSLRAGLQKRALKNPSSVLGSLLPKASSGNISLRPALPESPFYSVFWALSSSIPPPHKYNTNLFLGPSPQATAFCSQGFLKTQAISIW